MILYLMKPLDGYEEIIGVPEQLINIVSEGMGARVRFVG